MGANCNDRNMLIEVEPMVYGNSRSVAEVKLGNKQSPRLYLGSGIMLGRPTCIKNIFNRYS